MDSSKGQNAKSSANMAIDPGKTALTDIDPVANIPYLHESFILHSFVPIRYIRRQKPFDEPSFIGMYPEGFRIPTVLGKDASGNVVKKTTFDDLITCVLVGKETVGPDNEKGKGCDCVASEMSTRPGFINLAISGPVRNAKSAPALTREKTQSMLKCELSTRGKSSRSYLQKQNSLQEQSEIEEEVESLTPRSLSATPTSKRKQKKFNENMEYVLALKHDAWPESASEWCSRPRNVGWPGKRIEKKIIACGCHVIPKAHPKSEDPDVEWMYTFIEAERIINKEAISSAQRQCFILFCLLCMDSLEAERLSFQQLKSVFYFVCETLDPQLWRNNKAICVNKLLDQLLESIECGNLPDYFFVKNNTISHLEASALALLKDEITSIRKHPAGALIEMSKQCAFVNIFPFYCSVHELFQPLLQDAVEFVAQPDTDKSIRCILTITDELCNSFYLDSGFEQYEESYEEIAYYISSLIAHGVSGIEEAIEYFVKPIQGDKEAQKHIKFMPQLLSQKNISLSEKLPPTEIWRPIRMCRLIIKKFEDGKTGSDLHDHLGCMYHAGSKVYKDQKKDCLKNANEAFKQAISKTDCGIGTYADYGSFLCKTKKYEECIPMLRKVVLKETKSPESMNFYGKMESLVADEFIKREIDATDGLVVYSCAYAYYLICEAFMKLKKKGDLFKTLSQFEEFCTQTKDPHSLVLYGYSLMKVHQFKKAKTIFKMVHELQPENKLALNNVAVCDNHEGYNKSHADVTLDEKLEKLNLFEK